MVALDISWHIFLILLLSVKVVTVVFYAHSKWQQKARKSYVRLPGSTSSAGTASLKCQILWKLSKVKQKTVFYASPNIAFHISTKINGIMYFFGCLFSKPSLTIGVQNLKTIEKPLKAMVWGLKIIKWRWLNDPKTIEKPSSPMVSY